MIVDKWKSIPPPAIAQAGTFYTFQAVAEQILKVIHRVPHKQSGFWWFADWPLLNDLLPCEKSW